MGQWKSVLVLILFVSSSLAGCLESSVDDAMIDFVVEYESDSGVVIETYVDTRTCDGDTLTISDSLSMRILARINSIGG